jgi:hypothetical protein
METTGNVIGDDESVYAEEDVDTEVPEIDMTHMRGGTRSPPPAEDVDTDLEVPEVDMLRAGTRSPAPATISNTAGHEDNNSVSIHY